MDLIKAKTILSRLQAMHQALESNSQLSSLERDLILNYLRDLYTIYLEAEVQVMPTVQTPEISLPNEAHPVKESIQKTLEFKFDPIEEPFAPIVQIPVMTEVKPDIPAIAIAPVEPEKKPEAAVLHDVPKQIHSATSSPKNTSIRASIQELFDIKKGKELSDKLHELPLKDINRAIGINDRLEIISTLFGGQKSFFEQIVQDLNNLKSFEEAEDILGRGVALTYKWDHEDQKEKAIEFIRLVRRRYL